MTYEPVVFRHPSSPLYSHGDWNDQVAGNMNSGIFRHYATTTLTGTASSIDFTSIPSTHKHMLIHVQLRGSASADSVSAIMRFNGDTTNGNYESQQQWSGNGTHAAGTNGYTGMWAGDYTANNYGAGYFGIGQFFIGMYAETDRYKTWLVLNNSDQRTATQQFIQQGGGTWRSTAAINRLTIVPNSASWLIDSRMSIYLIGERA